MLQNGDPAPDFTLRDQAGRTVSLGDFAGRHLVLYFYPKDDTPGCTKEACGFRDAWDELRALGVAVLGVSPDTTDSHGRFAEKYRLPFQLLSDPDRKTLTAYGAYGEKTMYGKKVTGVIRSTVWIGPDGRVRRHWAKVTDAAEHPDRVLAALRDGL
jgi:thioredoxin-dependent peroxiredoxin